MRNRIVTTRASSFNPTYANHATQAWWYGSAAYPAHVVPLAAYPRPGGIGLVWAPFGWGGYYPR